jgi:hypothetical protein
MAGVRIVTPDWLWACAEPVGGHDPRLAKTDFPVVCVAGGRGEEDGGDEGHDPRLAVGMRRASRGVTIHGWLKLLCVW